MRLGCHSWEEMEKVQKKLESSFMTGDGDGKIGTLMLGVSGNILVSGSVGNTKLEISIESE